MLDNTAPTDQQTAGTTDEGWYWDEDFQDWNYDVNHVSGDNWTPTDDDWYWENNWNPDVNQVDWSTEDWNSWTGSDWIGAVTQEPIALGRVVDDSPWAIQGTRATNHFDMTVDTVYTVNHIGDGWYSDWNPANYYHYKTTAFPQQQQQQRYSDNWRWNKTTNTRSHNKTTPKTVTKQLAKTDVINNVLTVEGFDVKLPCKLSAPLNVNYNCPSDPTNWIMTDSGAAVSTCPH
jgi:hypothetical protein